MLDFLMNRIKVEELSPELLANANTIIPKINELLERFGEYRKCNSGYRSSEDQARINPTITKSKHMICAAIDISDIDGKLYKWVLANLPVLKELGFWVELQQGPWVHFQIFPPKSGNRIFQP